MPYIYGVGNYEYGFYLEESENRIYVFISKKYMVQVFQEKDGIIRLSINRTAHNGKSEES